MRNSSLNTHIASASQSILVPLSPFRSCLLIWIIWKLAKASVLYWFWWIQFQKVTFSVLVTKLKGSLCMPSCSVVSDYLWPPGLQPASLLCPWNFLGKKMQWGAISYSRGSSQPKDWTHISCISALAGGFFTISTTWESQTQGEGYLNVTLLNTKYD